MKVQVTTPKPGRALDAMIAEKRLRRGGIGSHTRPYTGQTVTWLTPPEIVAALGPFDLDPCAAPEPRPWPTAKEHITVEADGMGREWHGLVWLNPPYGPETGRWLKRLSEHNGGGLALVFARTETRMFQDYVWARADALHFIYGRPHFYRPDGTRAKGNSGGPVVLVGYGEKAVERLWQAGMATTKIPGFFVKLR